MKYLYILIFFISLAADTFSPLPVSVAYDREKALLGKTLFYDTRLSSDNSVGCITCHDLSQGGADAKAVSLGAQGREGNIQAPTLFNAVFNFRQFWNARAKDLKEQIKGPLHNPVEHDINSTLLAAKVNQDSYYQKAFHAVYGQEATEETIIDALAEFEKALVTPDSKFDRYLRNEATLTGDEQDGLKLFKSLGCVSCHNGVNLGANSLQHFGIVYPYQWVEGTFDRFYLTKKEQDKNLFKVPTLRNIALTAPYFHDGSALTLTEAIRMMAYYNLGLVISDAQNKKIEAFLKTLTGKKPEILKTR